MKHGGKFTQSFKRQKIEDNSNKNNDDFDNSRAYEKKDSLQKFYPVTKIFQKDGPQYTNVTLNMYYTHDQDLQNFESLLECYEQNRKIN